MNRIITEERLTTLLHKENMLSKIEIPDDINPFEATVSEEELSQYEPVKIKINSVMKKLQKSRVDWQSKPRKKSGFNKFQNFKYFVLKDILPTVNEIFNKNGLYSQYNLTKDYAELIITDSSTGDYLTYRIPVQKLDNPTMQNIGAINTYSKRYLYMNALEIEEDEDEFWSLFSVFSPVSESVEFLDSSFSFFSSSEVSSFSGFRLSLFTKTPAFRSW